MTNYLFGCLCSLLLVLPPGLRAQGSEQDRPPVTRAFFLKNAFVVQSPGKVIDLGGVLVRNGLIEAVGKNLQPPADAKVIAADSMYIYAGFIDGLSNVGVPKPKGEEDRPQRGGQREYNPSYERAGIQPDRRVAGLLEPAAKEIGELRALGFTAAHVVPRGNMLPGQGAVVLLADQPAREMVIQEGNSLFAQFTGASGVYPNTDMAIMSKFRELYEQARQYQEHTTRYAKNPRGMAHPAQDEVLAAFGASIAGDRPIYFAVDGLKEMYRALTLQRELGFPLALAELTLAQKAITPLQASGASLFLTLDLPKAKEAKKEDEPVAADPEKEKLEANRAAAMEAHEAQAALLARAGLTFGFSSLNAQAKEIRPNLQRMIKAGLTEDQALAALTTTPAKLLGLSEIMGSIEKGKIANLVVADQPYFTEGANVRYVFVDGMPHEYEVKKKKKQGNVDPDAKVVVAGTWALEIDVPMEQMATPTLTIMDDGGTLSGKLVSGMGTQEISSISLSGNNLTFSYSVDGGGQNVDVSFDLTIDGNSLEGSMSAGSYGSFDVAGEREGGPKK